jgi:hypothetical protein
MRLLKFSALYVLTLTLIGCVTQSVIFRPVQYGKNIDVIYQLDHPLAISKGKESVTGLTCELFDGETLIITVAVMNNRKDRCTLYPERITVRGTSNKNKIIHLPPFSARNFMHKRKKKQAVGLFFTAWGNAMEESAAATSTTYTNSYASGSAIASNGTVVQGSASGSATSTTYDPSKASLVRQGNRREFAETAKNMNSGNVAIDSGLLKTQTLFPGQSIQGEIIYKVKEKYTGKIEVMVPFGVDRHHFVLQPMPNK